MRKLKEYLNATKLKIKDGQQPKPSPLEVVSNTRFSY